MYRLEQAEGGITLADGFFADGINIGLKESGENDLGYIHSDTLCDVASVFTKNKFSAACIKHFKQKGDFKTNFVLVNSKNANALTGKEGIDDIEEILSNLPKDMINPVMSSTGVIGVRLPKEKIITGLKKFDFYKKNSTECAKAIMTTDSTHKEIAYKVTLEDGSSFKIGGIAKGAGMIDPAMATMLCFITTDADIPKEDMEEILKETVEVTFNAISVDGDTSTNDTVLLLSNRKSKAYDKHAFIEALYKIMLYLAKEIVRDGEGANKLVSFSITGAKSDAQAKKAAKALSNSLLVKTAVFGEDPNWGRIASTIGSCGIEADEEKLSISFDDVLVYDKGNILFDEENEAKAAEVMKKKEFSIKCDLGIGDGTFVAYSCDLSYEYIKINADYRT